MTHRASCIKRCYCEASDVLESPEGTLHDIRYLLSALEATQAALAAAQKDAERWQKLNWYWEDERDSGPGGRWWTSIHCDGKLKGPGAVIDTAISTTKEKK